MSIITKLHYKITIKSGEECEHLQQSASSRDFLLPLPLLDHNTPCPLFSLPFHYPPVHDNSNIQVDIIYINKEELKTVGRDILACAETNRHETFTAHWKPYRRVSSRGRRARMRFRRGARGEKPENDRPPFWFYGESIRTSVHGSHFVLLWKRHHRNAIVGTNMKYLCM